jgi:hypothetical protein
MSGRSASRAVPAPCMTEFERIKPLSLRPAVSHLEDRVHTPGASRAARLSLGLPVSPHFGEADLTYREQCTY